MVRIYTKLNAQQYAELTKWCIRNDRSLSYVVSHAVTKYLPRVTPYAGDAGIKVMSRTTPENAAAVKERGGTGWRWVNACVQELVND